MTAWHPVALSADIPARTAAPVRLHGVEIALWRDGAGRLAAWEDRCPHRGMRLSFGFVRTQAGEDRLACLYHGWQFDRAGHCRHIPAHPDMTPPGTIRTRIMPVREAHGLAWLAATASAQDPIPDDLPGQLPRHLPGHLTNVAPGAPLPVRSIAIAAQACVVAKALGLRIGAVHRRPGLTLGLHAPCPDEAMLHVGAEDIGAVAEAHLWAMAARDAIEAGRAVAWGCFA